MRRVSDVLGAIVLLALAAPLLNWVTTGDHLLKAMTDGQWAVASMDIVLLAGGGIALGACRLLQKRTGSRSRPAIALSGPG